jgi:hypothetical protein
MMQAERLSVRTTSRRKRWVMNWRMTRVCSTSGRPSASSISQGRLAVASSTISIRLLALRAAA